MRLFIAIEIPREVKDYLFTIKNNFNKNLAKVNWIAKKNLHLTLKFLGNIDEKLIPKIIEKLNEIKFDSFELELDNLDSFPNPNYMKVLWVGVKNFNKVIELQSEVEEKLREYFEKDKEFSAHITLGRIKFVKDKPEFNSILKKTKINKIKFKVDSFSLIKSELSKNGPTYINLEKFLSK